MSMGLVRTSMQSSLLPATKAMCLDGSRCVYCSSSHMHACFFVGIHSVLKRVPFGSIL